MGKNNLFSNNDSKLLEKSLLLQKSLLIQKSNIKGVNVESNNNNKTNIMTSNKSNIVYSPSSNKINSENKQIINRSDYLTNNNQSPK